MTYSTKRQAIPVKNFFIGPGHPLCILSGPCVIESEDHTMKVAETLKEMFQNRGCNLIFKSSFDKANRSSFTSFRGPGIDEGLRILKRVQDELDLPVVTDVHTPEQARLAGSVCDMIQIPAFLCRQTDLILAAGESEAAVNVKKGQFISPWDMSQVVDKLKSVNCKKILLTDRGTTFGYGNLVSDMRSLPAMQNLGFPACFDASHSVMLPGNHGTHSGGQREFIPFLSRAAVASGADAIFLESHPNPNEAKSDKHTVYPFELLPNLLDELTQLHEIIQSFEQYRDNECEA